MSDKKIGSTPYLESIFGLSGKVALVTGGNGGLGLGMAMGLGKAGARVVIAGRNEQKCLQAEGRLHEEGVDAASIKADVTRVAEVRAAVAMAVDRFGSLDILVNAAGIIKPTAATQMTESLWDQVLDVNLKGTLTCCQEAVRVMKGSKESKAKIINVGSAYSVFGGSFVSSYAASKGGVVQLTKSLAVEWASKNICVNAILPGWFETEMTAPMRMVPDSLKSVIKRTPMARFGLPDELAGAAVFLASAASDFVTGVSLWVDGGYSAA